MTEPGQSAMKPRPERVLGLSSMVGLMVLYWALSSVALWFAYDVRTQIVGGYYGQGQALALVAKMALIITILTSAVWFLVEWRGAKQPGWRLGWSVVWKTWAVLVVYMTVVLIRRQLWTPSQGVNDGAMFLPVVGYTNAQFLSESRWLSFLIEIIPIAGCTSGVLYFLRVRVLGQRGSARVV